MVSLGVIVVDVFVKELPEVSLAQGNDAGQALSSYRGCAARHGLVEFLAAVSSCARIGLAEYGTRVAAFI
jgi:hypothetical protein